MMLTKQNLWVNLSIIVLQMSPEVDDVTSEFAINWIDMKNSLICSGKEMRFNVCFLHLGLMLLAKFFTKSFLFSISYFFTQWKNKLAYSLCILSLNL